MRKRTQVGCYVVIAALLLLVPSVFAQKQTLRINDPASGTVVDGIYVGSYSATGSTGNVQITCDDFKDESNYNSATYTTNTFSSLGSTIWGSTLGVGAATKLYEEAAWLDVTIANMVKPSGAVVGDYSFAIWAVFDATDVAKWLTKYRDSATCNAVFGAGSWTGGACSGKGTGGLLATAATAVSKLSPANFANIIILTPTCKNGPGTCAEQEFLEIVPEGGSVAMYLLVAGLCCFAALYHRSRRQAGEGNPV